MGCGRHVDLRRKGACELTAEFAIASGYKNKQYHYVCSRACYDKMHNVYEPAAKGPHIEGRPVATTHPNDDCDCNEVR